MADNLASFKVFCQGGLNTSRDVLSQGETQPGSAISLINYEPAVTGGYRKMSGYRNDYGTVPGFGNVLGVCVANGVNDGILAARYDTGSTNYLYYWDTATSAWVTITTPGSVDVSTYPKVRFTRYNWGTPKVVISDGVKPAATYDGTTYTQITNANAPSAPKVSHTFKNHLFLAGQESSRAAIAHSAPNDPYTWTAAAGAGQLAAGFDVVQIKPFRDNLFVFGNKNIKKITVNSSDEFALENVTTNIGCVARDSVQEIGGDLMFLSPDGFRPVAGPSRVGDIEIETLSKPIQSSLVEIIQNEDMDALTAVVVRSKSQIRYFISSTFAGSLVETNDSIGIIGGLTNKSGSIGWEFGQLLGIRASCCTSDYVGTRELILHGDHDGNVYQQESGTSFNGSSIISIYSTPYLDFGETEQRKVLRKLNTFVRAEGPFEMNVAIDYDWGDYNTAVPSTYTQETLGAPTIYNGRNITYDGENVIYGGASKPIMTSNIQGSGFSVRATFVTDGQTEPFSIQGLVFEFSTAGRR